jgi:hypothetical protein
MEYNGIKLILPGNNSAVYLRSAAGGWQQTGKKTESTYSF